MGKKQSRTQLVDDICSAVIKEQGRSTALSSADIEKRFRLGVETPLAMHYLLSTNILPFDRIIEIHGPEDTRKSSLALQIGTWYKAAGGLVVWIGAEHLVVDVAKGMYGEDVLDEQQLFKYHEVDSASEAQGTIRAYLDATKKARKQIKEENENLEEGEEPLDDLCLLIVVDSVGACVSDMEKEKMAEDYGSHVIAPYARAWTTPIKELAGRMIESNATLLLINHETFNIGSYGKTTPGGTKIKFLKAVELRTSEQQGSKDKNVIRDVDREAIEIECRKNKIGKKYNKISKVEFCHDHRDGRFWFDFDYSFAWLLKDWLSAAKGNSIGPIEDLKFYSRGRTFSSDSGGFTNRPASEVADIIYEEHLEEFWDKFHVKPRPTFPQRPNSEPDDSGEGS